MSVIGKEVPGRQGVAADMNGAIDVTFFCGGIVIDGARRGPWRVGLRVVDDGEHAFAAPTDMSLAVAGGAHEREVVVILTVPFQLTSGHPGLEGRAAEFAADGAIAMLQLTREEPARREATGSAAASAGPVAMPSPRHERRRRGVYGLILVALAPGGREDLGDEVQGASREEPAVVAGSP